MTSPFNNVFPDMIGWLQDALASPGMDTRVWSSYGVVDKDRSDDEGGKAVQFTKEWGPTVRVVLQPDDNLVTCRVSAPIAGSLEASWNPFGAGDEVLVVMPGGSLLAPPVIVGRLNNELDGFPEKVAGKETNQNNLGFTRSRIPFIFETSSLWMVRSALTGAMLGIDELGNLTIRDGEGSALQFGPSGFAMQDKEGTGQIALNTVEGFASMWIRNTLIKMDGTEMNIAASGNVAISSAGNVPVLHAITLEQLINVLTAWLTILANAMTLLPNPITPASLAPLFDPMLAGGGFINAALAMAAGNANGAYGAMFTAIQGAVSSSMAVTPLTPGACCPAIVLG